MSRTLYKCDYCPELHHSRAEASMCCDPAAFNPADPDDNPDIVRSSD